MQETAGRKFIGEEQTAGIRRDTHWRQAEQTPIVRDYFFIDMRIAGDHAEFVGELAQCVEFGALAADHADWT